MRGSATQRLRRDSTRMSTATLPRAPPTLPCRKDRWSRSSVRDVLLNPKYTGYMVWNRRASKKGGKVNPPNAWVWSPQPTHELIVTKEMFEAALEVTRRRERSRSGSGPNAAHLDTKRSYIFRSFVICSVREADVRQDEKGTRLLLLPPRTICGTH